MKTRTLYDFGSEAVYISKNLHNGDWNYRLAIRVLCLSEYDSECPDKWNVTILAASPEAAGTENLNRAIASLGMSEDDLKSYKTLPLFQYEALISYGIFACLWDKSGNNLKKLMRGARDELKLIELLFGFYMDRPENRIGQNGWNLISGQDIREYLAQIKS